MEAAQRAAEALSCYALAVEAAPASADALWSLARLAAARSDPLAEPAAQLALARVPPDLELLARVGMALAPTRWTSLGIDCLTRALAQPATDALLHATLAELLANAGRPAEAVLQYRQAIARAPAWPELHNNLGILLRQIDRIEEARASFAEAVRLRPGYVAALYNLGNAWAHPSTASTARQWYARALEREPAHAGALHGLALFTDETEHRAQLYARAFAADPSLTEALVGRIEAQLDLCDWATLDSDIEEVRRRLRDQPGSTIAPFAFAKMTVSLAEQQACARNWVRHRIEPAAGRAGGALPASVVDASRARLRLGYLSADFRDHAVGRLLVDLLPAHDRQRVEVIGLDCSPDDGSATRARLKAGCDRFLPVGDLGLRALAERIRDEGIDVLIDLTGFTQGSRSEVLALRPVPVQVNWLGFPGTMGAPFVDAIFCDDVLVPPDRQPLYDEMRVALPGGYQPTPAPSLRAAAQAPQAGARQALGLPEAGTVYASFNAAFKLRPQMFAVWLNILGQVEGSVLWTSIPAPQARDRLRTLAATRGIDPQRLVFAAVVPAEQHLARLPVADLFLDGFPYSAGATASQCVAAGVPLITLTGETYVSRMATAILHAIGCADLAVGTLAEYEALAVLLGRSDEARRALRRRVLDGVGASPMFDPRRMAGAVESACHSLWHAFCNSGPHDATSDLTLPEHERGRQALP